MIDVEKCCITHYPAEVLAKCAAPIEKIDDNIRQLVEKMTDIMLKNNGVGMAGPQAGVPLRLFIISPNATREAPKFDKRRLETREKNVKVYINPTVTPIPAKAGTSLDSVDEGCLSVPGVYTKIRRYKKCRVTATDLDGNEFTEEAEGLYARVLQHEYDHIEGTTIVSRMGSAAKIAHRRQLKALQNAK